MLDGGLGYRASQEGLYTRPASMVARAIFLFGYNAAMRHLTLALCAAVLLSLPVPAPASTSVYWELWIPEQSQWVIHPRPLPTDGNKARLDRDGHKLCEGQIRRYVQRTHQSEQGQVQVRVKYTYYCLRIPAAKEIRLSPQQAPDCGPTVSAD